MNRKNVKEIKDKNRKREDKNKELEEKRCRKKWQFEKTDWKRKAIEKKNEDAI